MDVTLNGNAAGSLDVVEHSEISGKIVRFHQNLTHKKNDMHWSRVQEMGSIFKAID